ncbi:6-phosphogluconolactonase [Nibricoccus sp. IMCC34717]|uniref:6-phosphogluconolactonase n=1 Tax=Nibricoccus sp. IMCC34717 TaxID=3034021 RepID=UPI00384D8F1C
MRIVRFDDPASLARAASRALADLIASKPDSVILLPTGNTPIPVYRELAKLARAERLDCSRLRIVQLDEYAGVTRDDERCLFGWMRREVLDPLGIQIEQVVAFDACAEPATAACARMDDAIERLGGIDLSILGLGLNGHLGFNEPPCGPSARTRWLTLTPESLASNQVYWGAIDRVPRCAFTVGMDHLLSSRRIWLWVSGAAKQAILRRTLAETHCAYVPASWLQTVPERVTVFADRAALAAS